MLLLVLTVYTVSAQPADATATPEQLAEIKAQVGELPAGPPVDTKAAPDQVTGNSLQYLIHTL